MKKNTKKKSLFAASAMLAVAVVAATGATFAWFSSSSTAKSEISMGVDSGSSIEISSDGVNWAHSYTYSGAGIWSDRSISSADSTTFYQPTYEEGTTTITGYETAAPASVKLYFRSTKADAVKITTGTITAVSFDVAKADLLKWAQITIDDEAAEGGQATKVYSTSANNATNTVSGTAVDALNGSYTSTALGNNTIVTLAADGNGYYIGSATFYFFIEGTQTDNGDVTGIGEEAEIKVDLTFSQ